MKTRKTLRYPIRLSKHLAILNRKHIRVLLQSLKILFLLLQLVAIFPSKLYNCLISAIQTGKKDCCCPPDKQNDIVSR